MLFFSTLSAGKENSVRLPPLDEELPSDTQEHSVRAAAAHSKEIILFDNKKYHLTEITAILNSSETDTLGNVLLQLVYLYPDLFH